MGAVRGCALHVQPTHLLAATCLPGSCAIHVEQSTLKSLMPCQPTAYPPCAGMTSHWTA